MLAYYGDQAVKDTIIAQLAAHRAADELVKGQYWQNGKGCAVGCTIYSGHHAEYETRFGIPQMLARLEDRIFEGLPNHDAQLWPERFMGAIRPGIDLSRVGWQFLHWLLTDASVNPGIEDVTVRDAVRECANVLATLAKGESVEEASAAWSAANAAWSAARSAESAARSAESAARSVESAARSAESAAWSAESAASAAWSAAWSAWSARSAAWSAESAAWSARSAASAAWRAESAAYQRMAGKLVELIEAA
jgi:hypothetical protein